MKKNREKIHENDIRFNKIKNRWSYDCLLFLLPAGHQGVMTSVRPESIPFDVTIDDFFLKISGQLVKGTF